MSWDKSQNGKGLQQVTRYVQETKMSQSTVRKNMSRDLSQGNGNGMQLVPGHAHVQEHCLHFLNYETGTFCDLTSNIHMFILCCIALLTVCIVITLRFLLYLSNLCECWVMEWANSTWSGFCNLQPIRFKIFCCQPHKVFESTLKTKVSHWRSIYAPSDLVILLKHF